MIPYPRFYKATGVRLGRQMRDPKLNLLREFEFPKNAYFHFTQQDLNQDTIQLGIEEDNSFLVNAPKSSRIVIFHNTDYDPSIDLKNERVVKQNIQKPLLVKNYHREHPNFIKGFIDTGKANLMTNICVKNHVLVGADYTYTKTVLSEYNRMRNYWKSVFLDVGRTVLTNPRQHFVAVPLPSIIPSRSQLQKWETESKTVHANKFKDEARFLFAEFYSWIKGDTDSVFPLEPKVCERLNIIFYFKSVYFVVNLNELRKYIIPEVGQTDSNQIIDQDTMRKFFLLGAVKAVMDRGFDSTEFKDEDKNIDGVNEEDEVEQEEETEDNSVDSIGDDNDEVESRRLETFTSKRDALLNNSRGQVTTVEELLRIGVDRGFMPKDKPSKKEMRNDDAKIFNSEAVEEDADEETLGLLEEVNGDVELSEERVEMLKEVGYKKYESETLDLTTSVSRQVDKLALDGKHSSAELNRLKRIGGKWEDIQDPFGSGRKAPELIDIKPNDILIDKTKKLVDTPVGGVLDESMMYSSLDVLNKVYTEKILHRHILSSAVNLQRSGVCVTDYKLNRVENAFDGYEVHSFKLVPFEGQESTIKVKVPIVDEDGTFTASGVKSRMRTQRIDLPIRKINNHQIALTSYVSKFFVNRSAKAAYSQERWLEKQLIGLSNDRPDVVINFANVFKSDVKAPLKYTIMARVVSKITIGDYMFSFDVEKMNVIFGKDLVDTMNQAKKLQIIVGKNTKANTILVMSKDGTIFEASTEKQNDIKELGSIESILGFPIEKSPLDCIELQGYGDMPIVFILGYFLGLGNLLTTIGARFERHPKGTRIRALEDYEYTIRFSDEYLIFDRRDYRTQLIVAGFKQIAETIKHYSVYQFDGKDVYGSILLDLKKSTRVLKNLDVIRELWVDPITRDILTKMNEPTDFVDLLFSAIDKLTTDHHNVTRDERGFRQRGYERFAGFAYAEMVAAVMQHNTKPSKHNSRIEINPQAVWMKILQDKTTSPVEDSNPIHSLKESEVVVYRGTGGRDGQTLNAESRKYDINSVGILSDATVDNGDAGAVVYTTANPNYVNLLGMTEVADDKNRKDLTPTQILSTSSLLAPAIEFDDPKRRNFNSIQNSRTTNCVGLTLLPVRTGYENIIPYRVSKTYAYMAREDGVVTDITKNVIVIKTKSGKVERLPLGKRSGKWQGKVVPHELITELKVGDKFKAGAPITYNPLFFKYNWMAGALSYKQGLLATVALIESVDTLEDSSAMSSKLTSKLDTFIIEQRDIPVKFSEEIDNLIKVGQETEYETVLCSLLDTLSTTSSQQMFTGDSREILNDLAQINPKAEVKGKVIGIEAIYVGDPEDMTESLRAIVEKCDREKSNASKDMGKSRQDGSVNPGFRVNGVVLEPNTCVLRFNIECLQTMRTGSKVVVAHQMKSVTGRVWDEDVLTESGQEVDLFFGYQSLQNRIVTSPEVLGTTNKLMIAATKAVIKAYRGK